MKEHPLVRRAKLELAGIPGEREENLEKQRELQRSLVQIQATESLLTQLIGLAENEATKEAALDKLVERYGR